MSHSLCITFTHSFTHSYIDMVEETTRGSESYSRTLGQQLKRIPGTNWNPFGNSQRQFLYLSLSQRQFLYHSLSHCHPKQPPATGTRHQWLLVPGHHWPLATGYRPLATGHWSLATGHWTLATATCTTKRPWPCFRTRPLSCQFRCGYLTNYLTTIWIWGCQRAVESLN